jgi:hypothetical protein
MQLVSDWSNTHIFPRNYLFVEGLEVLNWK